MVLYKILIVLFLIGAIIIALINRKSNQIFENKSRWKKYFVYLLIVFSQIYLILHNWFHYFSLIILLFGFYEIVSIAKSKKILIYSLIFYIIFGWFFYTFFAYETCFWQQYVFIIAIIFDGFSQLIGQLLGKTKLFPIVSPNKTLEGFFGGLIAVIITTIALSFYLKIPLEKSIVFGILVAVLALIGDIIASFYKRLNHVKDYSQFIPNHGGFLDRFDSLIFAGFGFSFLLKIDFSNSLYRLLFDYVLIIGFIFLLSEVAYHSLKCKIEITRKFTHFTSGIVCLTFPYFIDSAWLILALCSGFILVLYLSQKFKILPSIHKIDRKSFGSLLFPVSVFGCYLAYQFFDNAQVYYYLPILILAVCDPLAALIGKKYPIGKFKIGDSYKTFLGSFAFFISCFIILYVSFYNCESVLAELIIRCFVIALIATITEALSKNGFDNLMIPIVVAFMLIIV